MTPLLGRNNVKEVLEGWKLVIIQMGLWKFSMDVIGKDASDLTTPCSSIQEKRHAYWLVHESTFGCVWIPAGSVMITIDFGMLDEKNKWPKSSSLNPDYLNQG